MSTTTTATATFVFLLLLHLVSAGNNRRILHQPFFPNNSLPPTQPPTSIPKPPTPKYPFSTPTPNNNTNVSAPFFPLYPSSPPPPPPPPSSTPTTFASFPANITSLILPHSSSKSKLSSKLVAVAVAAVIAAVAVVCLAGYLHLRNKRRRSSSDPLPSKSTPRSSHPYSSTSRPRAASNRYQNDIVPKLQRPSQPSSEFLYLGTLVSSHAPLVSNSRAENAASSKNMGSPELRPLPPLSGPQKNNAIYRNAVAAVQSSTDDDEGEEFYSPRASSIAAGSISRRDFNAVEVENVKGFSSTYSSSASASPGRSISLSLSPEHTPSSRNSLPKSQDLIEIQHIAPFHREGDSEYADSFNKESASSLMSPSPPSSSDRYSARMSQDSSSPRISNAGDDSEVDDDSRLNSPAQISCPILEKSLTQCSVGRYRMSMEHESSSPRISNVSDHHKVEDSPSNVDCPISSPQVHHTVDILRPPLAVTPPPPPPPPRKIWDSAKSRTPPAKKLVLETPSLVKSIRPIAMDGSPLISPIKLSSDESEVVGEHAANTESPVEEMSRSTEEPFDGTYEDSNNDPKTKLKPLHWDKVRASSDKEMVWDQLKCSSFKLNEEMIETLFAVKNPNSKPSPKETVRWQVLPSSGGDNGNKVLDPKKAQNIAILLKALNVTVEEVCDGLLEGNTDTLSTELLESLLKMAPSKEEERKLKAHSDDSSSPAKLGAAERFLKSVLDVPHAFKRLEAMLYISNFESEVEYLKKSFGTLEAACEELRTSRMFLKLLEAVLKTGNRMNTGTNRGDAQAFKLDTLLKLVDVKGTDGKTTLLHFVVQEIIRTEGARISDNNNSNATLNDESKCRKLGLQVVSSLSSELSNVKKGASMDAEVLSSDVLKLSNGLKKISDIIKLIEESESSGFSESMASFLRRAEEEIIKVQAHESLASSLVKEFTEYFHGNSAREEAHPLRIFMVVRDFLAILDRVCREVGMIDERTIVSSAHKFPVPVNPLMQRELCGTSFDEEGRG